MTRTVLMTITLAALAAVSVVPAASAHSPAHFDRSIDRLEQRIEAGRQAGTITYFEGRSLRRLVGQARRRTDTAFADNHLSKQEYLELRREIRFVARKIRHEGRDGWRRARFLPRVGR